MSDLERIEFSLAELARVEFFDCGDQPWSKAASEWIRGLPPFPSALQSMEQFGNSVWLYLHAGAVAGFGSLGPTRWKWPPPDGPRTEVGCIPMMAVHKDLHGQPKQGDTFATRILMDLVAQSKALGHRVLVLQVDIENVAAKRLYERCGFSMINGIFPSKSRSFHRMYVEHSEAAPSSTDPKGDA